MSRLTALEVIVHQFLSVQRVPLGTARLSEPSCVTLSDTLSREKKNLLPCSSTARCVSSTAGLDFEMSATRCCQSCDAKHHIENVPKPNEHRHDVKQLQIMHGLEELCCAFCPNTSPRECTHGQTLLTSILNALHEWCTSWLSRPPRGLYRNQHHQ